MRPPTSKPPRTRRSRQPARLKSRRGLRSRSQRHHHHHRSRLAKGSSRVVGKQVPRGEKVLSSVGRSQSSVGDNFFDGVLMAKTVHTQQSTPEDASGTLFLALCPPPLSLQIFVLVMKLGPATSGQSHAASPSFRPGGAPLSLFWTQVSNGRRWGQ